MRFTRTGFHATEISPIQAAIEAPPIMTDERPEVERTVYRVCATPLKRVGLFKKIYAGLCGSIVFFLLGIVIPFWPITLPICWLLALVSPFMFLGYRKEGRCPFCGEAVDITKRRGGFFCKVCRRSSVITKTQLKPMAR